MTCGDEECAVTQTEHFAASFALEWWCATNATAENNVSSRHRKAIRFENERITITARTLLEIYIGRGTERNRYCQYRGNQRSCKNRAVTATPGQ
jgi:hypothetical protein